MSDDKCRTCKGRGVLRYNINFGSGPSCYDTFQCGTCKGSGEQKPGRPTTNPKRITRNGVTYVREDGQ